MTAAITATTTAAIAATTTATTAVIVIVIVAAATVVSIILRWRKESIPVYSPLDVVVVPPPIVPDACPCKVVSSVSMTDRILSWRIAIEDFH